MHWADLPRPSGSAIIVMLKCDTCGRLESGAGLARRGDRCRHEAVRELPPLPTVAAFVTVIVCAVIGSVITLTLYHWLW